MKILDYLACFVGAAVGAQTGGNLAGLLGAILGAMIGCAAGFIFSRMWDQLALIPATEVWEKIGEISVDTGLVWIGDPSYSVTPDASDPPAQTWEEFCVKMEATEPAHVVAFSTGICVHTACGDGFFPVLAQKDSEGRILKIKIEF